MDPVIIIENEYATLRYYPDFKIIHHTFHQPISGDPFRAVLNAGAAAMEQYRATKWLSDDRGNEALNADDSAWSTSEWFPRAKAAGWKFWALVVPEDIAGRFSLTGIVEKYYSQGIRVRVFTELEPAMQWLVGASLTRERPES